MLEQILTALFLAGLGYTLFMLGFRGINAGMRTVSDRWNREKEDKESQ